MSWPYFYPNFLIPPFFGPRENSLQSAINGPLNFSSLMSANGISNFVPSSQQSAEPLPISQSSELVGNQQSIGDTQKPKENPSNTVPEKSQIVAVKQEESDCPGFEVRRRYKFKNSRDRPKNLISHNSILRNDTKNIPKNYGKAMLTFIQKNTELSKKLAQDQQVDFIELMLYVKQLKKKINTMHDLRDMWGEHEPEQKIKKCIRILSYHFMRIKCLPYIFNSRVKNFRTHIKYRKRIMKGIAEPKNFTLIKQF